MATEMERFTEACNYPATLDEAAVEDALRSYLRALGVERKIVRLTADWTLDEHPELADYGYEVIEDFRRRRPDYFARDASAASAASAASDASAASAASDARAARAASDASDASDAPLRRFVQWCVARAGWWWIGELSWLATTFFGAVQLNKPKVLEWARPVLDAFLSGVWCVHWTKDALYWVAKPVVHVERLPNGTRRLHHPTHAALESDLERLYFWHGVLVPAFVVVRPDWITVQHIDSEENAEVRRVMLERFGAARYVKESGAKVVDESPADHPVIGLRTAKLYRKDLAGDEPILMLDMLNSTPEPDGSVKRYMIRVDPNAYGGRAAAECHAAMASTYRWPDGSFVFKAPEDYRPVAES